MGAPIHPLKSVILVLDQAVGTMRLLPEDSQEEGQHRLVGVDMFPATTMALEQFNSLGLSIALILPDPSCVDITQDFKQFLPFIQEIVCGIDYLNEKLEICSEKLRTIPKQTLFVAADRVLRGSAANLGYIVAPHPLIAAYLARGQSLQFVRIAGDLERINRIQEVIPYHWDRLENGSWSLFGILSRTAIAQAIVQRFSIEVLPLDIALEDPIFVHLDKLNKQLASKLKNHKVLYSDGHRMLIAVGPAGLNDALLINGLHGHLQFLAPTPELLKPAPSTSFDFQEEEARIALSRSPIGMSNVISIQMETEIFSPTLTLCPSTKAFQDDVDRYCGKSSLDSSGTIKSRHIQHPDNHRVVQALVKELNAMGYCTHTNNFTHAGMTLTNVIADLPGTGYFLIEPKILKLLKQIFIKHPFPDPPEIWLKDITQLIGTRWFEDQNFNKISPQQLKTNIEKAFNLWPWYPWWLKSCGIPGFGAKIVLVCCHIDSTASSDIGYDPLTDPAPGADDDASGIASVLALARSLSTYRGKMRHTVRFCFFNAEEQGMVGSKSYASMLKASGAPIKAVVCMDMIGYNSDAMRIFEIHAGYSDPTVRDLSVPIAEYIASWAASLGALAPAQIYRGTSSLSGVDRNLYDPAINRADHASFHQQGYPAIVVSEDFFINYPTEPGADPNPNYHKSNDLLIDSLYASAITYAVAYAVKKMAME